MWYFPLYQESQKENGNWYYAQNCLSASRCRRISKGERQYHKHQASMFPTLCPESQKENGNSRRISVHGFVVNLWISKGERQSEFFRDRFPPEFDCMNLKRRTAMHTLMFSGFQLFESIQNLKRRTAISLLRHIYTIHIFSMNLKRRTAIKLIHHIPQAPHHAPHTESQKENGNSLNLQYSNISKLRRTRHLTWISKGERQFFKSQRYSGYPLTF